MERIFIREDFRRDGLCMNFLADEKMMKKISRSFPKSIINIGYPAICSQEEEYCKRITRELSNEPVETAVVGHSLNSHLEIMAEIANSAKNTSANIWIPFSDDMIKKTLKKPINKVLSQAKNSIKYWKTLSNRPIDIALVDSAKYEKGLEDRMKKFFEELKREGARSVILCDTRGNATPNDIKNVLSKIKKENAAFFEIHAHNDLQKAIENIDYAINHFGIKGVGTAIFGYGERGTMIDPREIEKRQNIPYKKEEFRKFKNLYRKMRNKIKGEKGIFRNNTVVTGTQYRLKNRDKGLKRIFGVTSDKHILSEKIQIDKTKILDKDLKAIKDSLYKEKRLFFSNEELKQKYNEIQKTK